MAWDLAILRFLYRSAIPWLDWIMTYLARSGRIEVVVMLAVIGVLILKHKHRLRDACFLTLALVGVVIGNLLVRTVVWRAPFASSETWAPTFDFGFPSSQAADTFAIAFAAAVLTWSMRFHWWIVVLGTFYVFTNGLSRVYLGLHYPSDILAGWALSFTWTMAVSLIRRSPGNPLIACPPHAETWFHL
jgi:undecaprenyl-diphosphatase